ncbi:MAG: sterol carrier family protein [Corynebacterium sp.]|nr:sterol carrier family protein [Corynebacterium sp.]MDO4911644.1 sterol carrier family protein [Corynebacterium sp.]
MILDDSILAWLKDSNAPQPGRAVLAAATKESARILASIAPGKAVEVRVPPFVAVQCVDGLSHRRGTPPNIVEMPVRQWLQLATGLCTLEDLENTPKVTISGTRAHEISRWMPIIYVRGNQT